MNLTPESKVLVQGITDLRALTHASLMKNYGTNVVAGISPGYGGQELQGIPVFHLIEQAIPVVGSIDTTVIFVPPYAVLDAALEAIAAGIRQIIIVTEGVPPLDMIRLVRKAEATETLVIGPHCSGLIVPNKLLLGTHPTHCYTPGPVGLISRSSTLTYEIASELTRAKLGQSIGVSIGSDSIIGSTFAQWLQILDEDDRTEVIVLVGEIGGGGEEAAAAYIAEAIDKPVIAYIAGRHIPKGKLIGHASGLMLSLALENSVGTGTAKTKIAAFQNAKIPIADRPSQIPALVKKALKKAH